MRYEMFLPIAIVLLLAGYTGANIEAKHHLTDGAKMPTEQEKLRFNRNANK
jgi:hypothetical protein